MNEIYIIDPLSIAANGFDLFAENSNALSVASLGFIKLQIVSIVKKKGGGAEGVVETINIWKDIETHDAPSLTDVVDALKKHGILPGEKIEIVLEPINQIEISLQPIQNAVSEVVSKSKDLKIELEVLKEEKNVKISLQKIDI